MRQSLPVAAVLALTLASCAPPNASSHCDADQCEHHPGGGADSAVDPRPDGSAVTGPTQPPDAASQIFGDSDGDTISDLHEGLGLVDTDSDGIPDSEDSEPDSAPDSSGNPKGNPDWWCEQNPSKC